jgi:hypothetical protein
MTLTKEQQDSIATLVQKMHLSRGVGNKESACSIAAINIALTGELTDRIPDCMSDVIGRWIIAIQDRMPAAMRNSSEWKRLLPLAAGTGKDNESERLSVVMDWMWESLKLMQPTADAHGFGEEWTKMCSERSSLSAVLAISTAEDTAYAHSATCYPYAAVLAAVASNARDARAAASSAAMAAAYVTDAPSTPANAWDIINPPALLARLIALPVPAGVKP